MTPSPSPSVLLLASDLMLSSTVSGYAASAGLTFRSVSSVADVVPLLSPHRELLLLVDLGTPGLDVAELAASLSPEILSCAVAYGPHVHEAKLQAAVDAGFGQVMSRGRFSAGVGRIIAAQAGS